ncbi:alkaline phosphatase family protein [Vibrio sp. WXL210]|uniref:alkaline phosphatase family protein n=1 Tax=Vibrio sp. WXL210 TaxID=3450709 RepID=UPI003EC52681
MRVDVRNMLALGLVSTLVSANVHAAENPSLVLQITVDALRGDLPTRYNAQMGEGGFNYLMKNGLHFNNAHYQHANTETIVGHAALATGTTPSVNGMVANVWYDRADNRPIYNIEDSNFSLLTSGADVDSAVEVDDTQRVAQGDGRSPVNLYTSTIADEMVKASNGKSKAVAISFKDRAAVSMAGSLGKAFWFSKASGDFVSSDYYYSDYPDWVTQWNDSKFIERYHNQRWELLYPREGYLFAEEGDISFKTELATFKRSFPYPYGPSTFPYFTTMLSLSPAGDEIVADFTKQAIESEQLGQGEYTDYLSVSFSALDYVIHVNGPSSIEAEDALLRLDNIFADLFEFIDDKVGLDNTLIVLSADHGAPDTPSYIANFGAQKKNLFDVSLLEDQGLFAKTAQQFGLGSELVLDYSDPYLYLDHELITAKGHKVAKVQRFIADQLVTIAGVHKAVTAEDIVRGNLNQSRINQLVINNYFPARSGDIHLIFEPGVYINEFDSLQVASVHGSPWRYDTYVPVMFAGSGLKAGSISRQITPYDIAPTIANLLGVTAPTGATGEVLHEVADKK